MRPLAGFGRAEARDGSHPERLSGGEASLAVLGKVFPWCEQGGSLPSQQRLRFSAVLLLWGCVVTQAQVRWAVLGGFCIPLSTS